MSEIADPTPPDSSISTPWSVPAGVVLSSLGSSLTGLAEEEAAARLVAFGENAIESERRVGARVVALHQFSSPLIVLLIVAAALSLALDEVVDALIIAAALAINAIIGFVEEFRAARSMEAMHQLAPSVARVLRAGREREIEPRLLVPGDVVLVPDGAKVPADCRILHAVGAEVDESILTGESVTVVKAARPVLPATSLPDRTCMLHHGTLVARGHLRAVVTATGAATELGRLASRMRGIARVQTSLQRSMDRFSRVVAVVVLAACGAGLAVGLALGEDPTELGLSLVALAVAAIPEGLPIVLTVALAISMQRMGTRRVMIRRLAAVETLGSCSAIGSDKTGTLTRNRMTVRAVISQDRRYDVTGDGLDTAGVISCGGVPVGAVHEVRIELPFLAAVLCSDASVVAKDGSFDAVGDPTEIALLVAAAKAGIAKDELEERYPRVAEIPFDATRRFMATYNDVDGELAVFVKGAPEEVLRLCSHDAAGGALNRDRIRIRADELAREGMRVLAVADRRRAVDPLDLSVLPGDLRFLALLGMVDPPRSEARAAVEACHRAGIRVLMITGDHASTARVIAQQVGIVGPDGTVVSGADLDECDREALDRIVRCTDVFARMSPQHKLAVVEALRRDGQTVAVTGDGVNDAPALRSADIGVAMGRSGTDVAREAADIVILDDDFAGIVAAVEEGRIAFGNVRKTTFFLVSTGAAAIIAMLASIVGRFDAPFIAAQLIWLNVVTNGVQDVALAFEPGEGDELDRRPRPRSEGVLSRLLWERAVIAGTVMAIGTLGLFLYELHRAGSLEQARTVAVTTMVLFSALHVGNARSEHRSAFARSPLANRFLLVGTLSALAIHVSAMYFGPTQRILRIEPLNAGTWVTMLAVSLGVVAAMEAHKRLRGHGD